MMKTKRLQVLLMTMVMMVMPAKMWAQSTFSGSGTEAAPYQIATAAQLKELSTLVNAGNATYKAAYYVLTANIENLGAWTPIGNATNPFQGVFNGQGHSIKGMSILKYTTGCQGLFGKTSGATVKNFSIGGEMQSSASSSSGSVEHIGGAIGWAYNSTVEDITSSVNISLNAGTRQSRVGGVIGGLDCSVITGCTYTGTLDAGATSCVAGIVAYTTSDKNIDKKPKISNCHNAGTVKTTYTSPYIAGILGYQNTAAFVGACNCLNTGSISAGEGAINIGAIYGYYGQKTSDSKNNYYLTGTATKAVGADNGGNTIECTAVTAEQLSNGTVCNLVGYHNYQDDLCTLCHDCKAAQQAADGYYEIDSYGKLLWYLKQRGGTWWRININGRLISDIDASGHAASLYPNDRNLDKGYTFDGNQHTISGLTIASGLFNDNNGTIKNLGICESEMTGQAGAIAYFNSGTMDNCFSYGNKIGNGGGLVYRNAYGSKMSGCWSAGVSKLFADNFGSVSNSYAYAATDAREVTGGALCYALCQNGANVWRQTLGSDLRPVWNNTHAVVYATTPCHSYNNNGPATLEHNYVEVGSVTNCLTESYKTMHCTQCLEDIRTDVAILGHHFEDGACIRCQLEAPHNPLCFTAGEDQATVCLSKVGTPEPRSLMYSTNGTDWYNYAIGTTLTLVSQGDKVYMAAQVKNEYFASSLSQYYQYVLQKSIAASGDITTLLDAGGTLTILNTAFYRLFMNCSSLTQAPELPATTIGVQCYQSMFQGCTSLTQAPELPARSLTFGCYNSMFKGCTSLTQAPELPATTMANNCYSGMFNGCTSLTQAPELPATTMAQACYSSMFQGCTSLTQAPELPATTMATGCCNSMFQGCTSLTQAPELPATTMANYCYYSMFEGCTSLTKAPSKLPAATMATECCSRMFYGCTSLKQAPQLPATTMAEKCYFCMFYGCTSLTQAPELPATTMAEYCYEGMFNGCTSLTQAPELPATTMAQACYAGMFEGCTSLRIAEIGATTLADACFRQMFHDCTSLRSLTIHYAQWDYPKASCWLKNTGDSQSIFYCPKGFAAPTERNEETIPENWTIVNGMPGDMNDDSNYSIEDITLLVNHILTEEDWNAIPDMNNDGVVNAEDVKLLERKVLTR